MTKYFYHELNEFFSIVYKFCICVNPNTDSFWSLLSSSFLFLVFLLNYLNSIIKIPSSLSVLNYRIHCTNLVVIITK